MKKRILHPEYQLQKQVCFHIKKNYRQVPFLSDAISNVRLTIPQQARNKAIQDGNFACPDLMLFAPTKLYRGLFIELKVKSPYKVNGELLKSDHLEKQQLSLDKLTKYGYCAVFSWGLDETKLLIDNYLKGYEIKQSKKR